VKEKTHHNIGNLYNTFRLPTSIKLFYD